MKKNNLYWIMTNYIEKHIHMVQILLTQYLKGNNISFFYVKIRVGEL
jgi:hypothetical protein